MWWCDVTRLLSSPSCRGQASKPPSTPAAEARAAATPCPEAARRQRAHAPTPSQLRRWLLLSGAAALLAACGFRPRGWAGLAGQRFTLNLPPEHPWGQELAAQLLASGAQIVPAGQPHDWRLELTNLEERRDILALDRKGHVREYALRAEVTVRVFAADGHEPIPPTRLSTERDYSYDDANLSPRAAEENLLRTDMRRELIQRALLLLDRRLAGGRSAP